MGAIVMSCTRLCRNKQKWLYGAITEIDMNNVLDLIIIYKREHMSIIVSLSLCIYICVVHKFTRVIGRNESQVRNAPPPPRPRVIRINSIHCSDRAVAVNSRPHTISWWTGIQLIRVDTLASYARHSPRRPLGKPRGYSTSPSREPPPK